MLVTIKCKCNISNPELKWSGRLARYTPERICWYRVVFLIGILPCCLGSGLWKDSFQIPLPIRK